MVSNSKLMGWQKADYKILKSLFNSNDGEVFSFPDKGITIAIIPSLPGNPACNTSRVSMSVCSPNEIKFRRKVGEYIAMQKMYDGEFMAVPLQVRPGSFAVDLANLFHSYL